jgi:hypothetical protein
MVLWYKDTYTEFEAFYTEIGTWHLRDYPEI